MPDVESFQPFEARYTIPAVETIPDEPDEIRRKQRRVRELCAEHNAILLAHHYQRSEVQEIATPLQTPSSFRRWPRRPMPT
jgi:quinolinate synthase